MRNRHLLWFLPVVVMSTVSCGAATAPTTTPTQDIGSIVDATLTALASSGEFVGLPPAGTGSIQGSLSYPSEFVPAMRVVAYDVNNPGVYYYVDTADYQGVYLLELVPPGTYHVVTYPTADLGQTPGLGGGYSQAVLCGLLYGCDDHTLLDVVVSTGKVTLDINPDDWYAPVGTFPPMPVP